ncbi:MAG: hypothetical protein L6Q59_14705 [Ignavibacteriaceae bacterium]|nr:hypothetical protein [Ignavibacteriaceae bacterium]
MKRINTDFCFIYTGLTTSGTLSGHLAVTTAQYELSAVHTLCKAAACEGLFGAAQTIETLIKRMRRINRDFCFINISLIAAGALSGQENTAGNVTASELGKHRSD